MSITKYLPMGLKSFMQTYTRSLQPKKTWASWKNVDGVCQDMEILSLLPTGA